MKNLKMIFILFVFTMVGLTTAQAQRVESDSPLIGTWDLTITMEKDQLENLGIFRHGLMASDGFPGWLEVKLSGLSTLVGYYVGYEGSARPIAEVHYSESEDKYHFTIPPQWMDIDDIYFEFTLKDDKLWGYKVLDGNKLKFTGVRAPSLERKVPPVWGNPINLLTDNMDRWIIPENNKFEMIDGILVNKEKGGNLITNQKFNDFKLSIEFRYPEGSNSGIYLRGNYEVQVVDSYGKDLDPHNMGAVYSRITPSEAAERQAGEWQSLDITLVDRHVTVILNGKKIVDNQAVDGPTGGAISSDVFAPGPIYLQGDHGTVAYRNIVLTPVL